MARSAPPQQTSADLAPVTPPWRVSDEVEHLARELIRRYPVPFGFIDGHSLRIAYLLRTDAPPEEAKIDTVAKCLRATGPLGFLADIDFVIWVNEWWWNNFPQHREAIVLHELLHVGVSDRGRPALNKHDVEEFIGVAAQYGAWEGARRRFAEALAKFSAEHPDPDVDLVQAVANEAEARGASVERKPDGSVVIDATKLDELRNRARDARESKSE